MANRTKPSVPRYGIAELYGGTSAVPEPGCPVLAFCGAALLGLRRRAW